MSIPTGLSFSTTKLKHYESKAEIYLECIKLLWPNAFNAIYTMACYSSSSNIVNMTFYGVNKRYNNIPILAPVRLSNFNNDAVHITHTYIYWPEYRLYNSSYFTSSGNNVSIVNDPECSSDLCDKWLECSLLILLLYLEILLSYILASPSDTPAVYGFIWLYVFSLSLNSMHERI